MILMMIMISITLMQMKVGYEEKGGYSDINKRV